MDTRDVLARVQKLEEDSPEKRLKPPSPAASKHPDLRRGRRREHFFQWTLEEELASPREKRPEAPTEEKHPILTPTIFISYSHKDETWKERLAKAKALIAETGHHRRDGEAAELEREFAPRH